jgi:WW domain-binding protein 2
VSPRLPPARLVTMADGFLAEQSAWTIAQIARTNDEDSWVMLTRDGKIVPIPGEKILYTSRTRVALEVTTPKELQVAEPFSIKNGDGVAYITNERVSLFPGPHRTSRRIGAREQSSLPCCFSYG